MRLLAGLLLAFGLAAGLGLWVTWIAVERPPAFGAIRSGLWTAFPGKGGTEADPYQRAVIARNGEAPLPGSDAVVFTTSRDDAGRRLRGDCDYGLEGDVPAARFWTLSVYGPHGELRRTPSSRYALSSTDMVHEAGRPWTVRLSPAPGSGNWLQTPPDGPFTLALRLYEATTMSQLQTDNEKPMPSVRRGECR